MSAEVRWQNCVYQKGDEAEAFLEFFKQPDRTILVLAGGGFDPRSTAVVKKLASATDRMKCLLIREDRPNPPPELVAQADRNREEIQGTVKEVQLVPIQIFAADLAVTAGREIAKLVGAADLSKYTDVVVDVSALSKGVAFPMVRAALESLRTKPKTNLHLMVAENADIDSCVEEIPNDRPEMIAGFSGAWGLDATRDTAIMWLPQLRKGNSQRSILDKLYKFVDPDETCPILPFPARNPRLPDELLEEYLIEIQSTWQVDPGDLVYAHESDPLDVYRAILRLDDIRKRVFREVGGSQIVLSPLGSKVLGIGALMAALARDFPVAYVEAIEYRVELAMMNARHPNAAEIVHVWLHGEAYGC